MVAGGGAGDGLSRVLFAFVGIAIHCGVEVDCVIDVVQGVAVVACHGFGVR